MLPTLTPIMSEWMRELIASPELLSELTHTSGSPVHVHNPNEFKENIELLKRELSRLTNRFNIFYACKSNKSKTHPRVALEQGIGLDVSSMEEFDQAVRLRAQPDAMILTGAVKPRVLLEKAINYGVMIVVDNWDELTQISSITKEARCSSCPIALRVSGFTHKGVTLATRFGLVLTELPEVARFLKSSKGESLILKGLHFHLAGYSIEERVSAFEQLLKPCLFLRSLGFPISIVDIGGGIPINYLERESEWIHFFNELRRAVRGERSSITWNNDGLGLSLVNGQVQGDPRVYPFWNDCAKGRFLRRLLDTPLSSGRTVAQSLSDFDLDLRIEPGRALLDQVGMTISRVAFRKTNSLGDHLTGLEMNYTNLLTGSADFLSEPQLVSKIKGAAKPCTSFLVGNYCEERDIILKRKISFRTEPALGDHMCFINTAGYFMHLHETTAHSRTFPANLTIARQNDGKLIFIDD